MDIFNTCVNMIASINEHQKGIAKQILYPVLPQFTEAFVQALQVPDGPISDSGLKMEVLKVEYFAQSSSHGVTKMAF